MTDTSTIRPSDLLVTVEGFPFPERLKYVAGVPTSQRRALRAHLDQLTNIVSNGSGQSRYQSERLALMMALDKLEQEDSGTGATSPAEGKKGTSKVASGGLKCNGDCNRDCCGVRQHSFKGPGKLPAFNAGRLRYGVESFCVPTSAVAVQRGPAHLQFVAVRD